MNAVATAEKPAAAPPAEPLHPAARALRQIESRADAFKAALPAHIPTERFIRVVGTAIQRNPDLALADRASLFNASLQAAHDGLLPDGREGALVIYNKQVQWMPMIAGILKKVRNSGELASIVARVVYAGDKFRNWIDDTGEHLEYEASPDADLKIVRCVFAMAKLKDGSIEVEVLRPADVEKIRNVSRAKNNGPWVSWWDQMAQKSALRRLSKRLPISTDLDDLIRRDDALYDLDGASDKVVAAPRPKSLAGRLDDLAGPAHVIDADPETGEIAPAEDAAQDGATAGAASGAPSANPEPAGDAGTVAARQDAGAKPPSPASRAPASDEFPGDKPAPAGRAAGAAEKPAVKDWLAEGKKARGAGVARKAVPGELRKADAESWIAGWDEADAFLQREAR